MNSMRRLPSCSDCFKIASDHTYALLPNTQESCISLPELRNVCTPGVVRKCWRFANFGDWESARSIEDLEHFQVSQCYKCIRILIWHKDRIVFPSVSTAPPPNTDMPEEIKVDYLEAAAIAQCSPRAASALLRLAVQKLCKYLGGDGKNINNDIAKLVKNGLPVQVQKSFDTIRVFGNESVYPGQISVAEMPETIQVLFKLLNMVVQRMITDLREQNELYESLPKSSLDAISARDSKQQ